VYVKQMAKMLLSAQVARDWFTHEAVVCELVSSCHLRICVILSTYVPSSIPTHIYKSTPKSKKSISGQIC